MSYTIVGHCPECGAPVYAESPWWGTLPPPSMPSCGCNPPQWLTSTTGNTFTPPSIPEAEDTKSQEP